ncbi:MAG: 1,4-dihydroxy-6-naphthoate synthase [Planctomycetales bacterium]|nr:1,4-dihydroxy-6-naphthoate synthase [Planctomycetales bacterium]
MKPTIRLGISTCPNDTFTFHALLTRRVDWRGIDFQIELLDIQQLNDRLFQGELDVAKASFHAALHLADRTIVLPSGSALGFGVGPLLLAAVAGTRPEQASQLTLCPGADTTATLLFKLFYPRTTAVEQVLFSQIMPRLVAQQASFGVCIHEGRFTWQQQGLSLVEDLGTRWEGETGCPLPLGGILASRSLPPALLADVQATIRDSLEFALAHPDETLPTMRQFAQEFDDHVLRQHVELYVNDWTRELGDTGAAALKELSRRAKQVGAIANTLPDIEVLH